MILFSSLLQQFLFHYWQRVICSKAVIFLCETSSNRLETRVTVYWNTDRNRVGYVLFGEHFVIIQSQSSMRSMTWKAAHTILNAWNVTFHNVKHSIRFDIHFILYGGISQAIKIHTFMCVSIMSMWNMHVFAVICQTKTTNAFVQRFNLYECTDYSFSLMCRYV